MHVFACFLRALVLGRAQKHTSPSDTSDLPGLWFSVMCSLPVTVQARSPKIIEILGGLSPENCMLGGVLMKGKRKVLKVS